MPDEPWRVELVRSGGFAGIRRTATLELGADEGRALAAALDAAEDPGPPSGADRFRFELTVTGTAGEHARAVLREGAVPEAVRPVLDRLRGGLS